MPIYDFTKNTGGVAQITGFVRHPRRRNWGTAVGGGGGTPGTIVMMIVVSEPTVFNPTVTGGGPTGADAVLLENGDELLLETGDKWLVESGNAAKITAFTANTTPAATDLVFVVDDGTTESQKMTLANLRTYLLS